MSKWDKLLQRICSLSSDMRFDELRKVIESYGYVMAQPRKGAVIIHSGNQEKNQSLYPGTSRLKRYMFRK